MAYGKTDDEMRQLVDKAEQAFWAVIFDNFPEVKTGDFPPDAEIEYSEACRLAVDRWLGINYPMHRLSKTPRAQEQNKE